MLLFTKMQALGNDFIVLDDLEKPPGLETRLTSERARRLCDRHFGIGADQILWIRAPRDPKHAVARMEVWNADGSTSEMCGNGLRAVALALFRSGRVKAKRGMEIETELGVQVADILDSESGEVRVCMGKPLRFDSKPEAVIAGGLSFPVHRVSMGNPHAVVFLETLKGASPDLADIPLEAWGSKLEQHPAFAPGRTNVEFVTVSPDQTSIQVRVWERGAGATLACGSGACAAAVATWASARTAGRDALKVQLPGGTLKIFWDGSPEGSVFMEGPAIEVFRGETAL